MSSHETTGPPPLARPAAPVDETDAPRTTLLELATALQTRMTDRDLHRYLALRRFFRRRLGREPAR